MQKKIIKYNPILKDKARKLRKNSTLSEVLLWNRIKRRQLRDYQFLRQKPVDNFIVDFFCKRLNLVIEIDGDSHIANEKSDVDRQKKIESLGISFLRFSDSEVKNNIDGVIQTISIWIDEYEERGTHS